MNNLVDIFVGPHTARRVAGRASFTDPASAQVGTQRSVLAARIQVTDSPEEDPVRDNVRDVLLTDLAVNEHHSFCGLLSTGGSPAFRRHTAVRFPRRVRSRDERGDRHYEPALDIVRASRDFTAAESTFRREFAERASVRRRASAVAAVEYRQAREALVAQTMRTLHGGLTPDVSQALDSYIQDHIKSRIKIVGKAQ